MKKELEGITEPEFAKAGHKATETVDYSAGPLEGPNGKLEHTLEPTLRKNGMPTKLNKGVIELITDYTLCKKGESLSPAQAALLRIFDIKMSAFEMRLVCKWHDDTFEAFEQEGEDESEDEEDLEELEDPFKGY